MVYQTGIAAVTYTYADALLSQLDRKTFRGGAEQHQYYNFAYNLWGQSTSIKVGDITLASYTYADVGGNPTGSGGGLLSKMTYGNDDSVEYSYDSVEYFYDAFDRTEKVLYNDTGNYIEYLYTAEGALGELRYKRSNGTVINSYAFEYDSIGRLIRSTEYDASGQPVQRTEHLYDEHNRLSQQNWNIQGDSFSERYVYNDPDPAVANDPGDGSLSQMTTATGDKINYTYNGLKMLSGTSITDADTNAELFKTAYAYLENDNNLTPRVEYRNVRKPNGTLIDGYKYTYDALGNITAIYESELKGSNTQRRQLAAYTYDDQNQLIWETIYTYVADSASTYILSHYSYTYDTAGNLLEKTLTRGSLSDPEITETSYTYDNSQWNNLLTAYDGGKIAYEGQTYRETTNKIGTVTSFVTGTPTSGNPISYYNGTRWSMEWQHGRNLKKATNTTTNSTLVTVNKVDTEVGQTYTYDADGIRTGKISTTKVYKYRSSTGGGEIMSASVDPDATLTRYLYSSTTVNHSYITQNGKVVRETIGSGTTAKVLDFIYDESGKPFALVYTNGAADPVTYYYVLNLQGDVVGLIDASGAWVAEYTYNAWGEITRIKGLVGEELVSVLDSNPDHIANLNPLRYRGYYYDTETGFYYLQSRYYDPVTHRFINADSIVSTGQGFVGTNVFAYCNNCPVVFFDQSGKEPVAIFAFCCIALGVIFGYIAAEQSGEEGWGYWSVFSNHIFVAATFAIFGAYAANAYGATASAGAGLSASTASTITSGGGIGFETYNQLKQHLGSAGSGYQWHHIVEQCQEKATRANFGAYWVQNTMNVVKVTDEVHRQISAFYSRIPNKDLVNTGGKVFRDWLTSKSFEEQYEWGLWVLRLFGVEV